MKIVAATPFTDEMVTMGNVSMTEENWVKCYETEVLVACFWGAVHRKNRQQIAQLFFEFLDNLLARPA